MATTIPPASIKWTNRPEMSIVQMVCGILGYALIFVQIIIAIVIIPSKNSYNAKTGFSAYMPPGFPSNFTPPGFPSNFTPPGFPSNYTLPGYPSNYTPPGFPGYVPSYTVPPGFPSYTVPPDFPSYTVPPGLPSYTVPPYDYWNTVNSAEVAEPDECTGDYVHYQNWCVSPEVMDDFDSLKASKKCPNPFDIINPYNVDPHNINPYNVDPHNINPYDIDPYNINPYNVDPHNINPYDIYRNKSRAATG